MPIKKKLRLAKKADQKEKQESSNLGKTLAKKNNYGCESNLQNFFGIKKYLEKQSEEIQTNKKKQFAFFILGFLIVYLLLTSLTAIIGNDWIKQNTLNTTQELLSIQGLKTTSLGTVSCTENNWLGDTVQGNCYSFFIATPEQLASCEIGKNCINNGKTIIISWLCTGALEIIILIGAIIASFGVSWKKKAIGIAAAIILGVIFNLLRIIITINLILSQNLQTVELAHDLLFRLILFVYIVAVYVGWFYFSTPKKDAK